jgi:hypothetical protein
LALVSFSGGLADVASLSPYTWAHQSFFQNGERKSLNEEKPNKKREQGRKINI